MTFRAAILGLLGAALVAGFGYVNDQVMRLTYMVGNHFPISVFGLLILFMLVGNPLLHRLRPPWRLRPGELAVIFGLMLVACSIPGSSLMRSFFTTLVMPIQHNASTPGWRKNAVMSYVPAAMMPAGGTFDPEVMEGYLSGRGQEGRSIGREDEPGHKLARPLKWWIPLLLLSATAVISLSLVVHRQWASHERLRYPVSNFAEAVISQSPGRATGPVFRARAFWIGLGVIFAIHVVNGIHAWDPDFLEVQRQFDFREILNKWPKLARAPGGAGLLFNPTIYPSVVAFAYFLASDVSFSLGIAQYVCVLVTAGLISAGVDVSFGYMTGGPMGWMLFGSGLGVALILLYIGRRYYGQVARQAVGLRSGEAVESGAVWALRVLVLAAAGITGILVYLGLDWPLAVLAVLLTLMLFLVMARVNAESGLFYFQPYWQPLGVLMGLFGLSALGPEALVIVGIWSTVMTIDPRECLMPFMVNVLKLCDDHRIRPARVAGLSVGAFALGLAVAVPVVLWANYNRGVPRWDGWATQSVPKFTFNAAESAVTKLKLSGELEASEQRTAWQRLKNIRPERKFLWAAGLGLVLVLSVSFLRLRLAWWPIHPVLFLVVGTWPLTNFGPSFLLGWLVKVGITRLGGGGKYRKYRPFMVGLIAGDLLGGLLWMVIGAIYYGVTGLEPKQYIIFPT